MSGRGQFLIDLTDECLTHGALVGRHGKTIGVVTPDGSVKRVPTIRVQVAVWTRYRDPDGDIAMKSDRWMTEKIDRAIDEWRRRWLMTPLERQNG